MNYASIKEYDIANGVGVRVSVFVSGCTHHCKGCFNRETWNFDYGEKWTKDVEDRVIELCKKGYIKGLTLLGGEPFEPQNQEAVCRLIKRFKEECPQKDIWAYSGYTFDKDLSPNGKAWTKWTKGMLENIDVLVDGEFVLELKNLRLKFRGSSNQRIIDVPASLKSGNVVQIPDTAF